MPAATPAELRAAIRSLRDESAAGRVASRERDALSRRVVRQAVAATGKLADPDDLPYSGDYVNDPAALSAAIDDLLTRRPHYASRRPTGDVGQGVRGDSGAAGASLADILRGGL